MPRAAAAAAAPAAARLLAGSETTPLLVVADAASCRGLPALQHLARSVASRHATAAGGHAAVEPAVVAVLFEATEEAFAAGVGSVGAGGVCCVSVPLSTLGWPLEERAGGPVPGCIRTAVEGCRGRASRKVPLVVVDSASPYVAAHGAPALCRELRGVLDDGVAASVAVVLHRDLAGAHTAAAMRSVCSAFLELFPPGRPPRAAVPTCRLEMCRASGKVVVENLTVGVADYRVTFASRAGSEGSGGGGGAGARAAMATTDAPPPPASQAAAVKPYTLSEEAKRGILEGGAGAPGLIYYQPDDADDFDDEDPDDDLDI